MVGESAKKIYDMLEEWEAIAYSQGRGADWLEQLAEGFRLYAQHCAVNGLCMTVKGFMLWMSPKAPSREGKEEAK
jgi:hypothetical protein